MPPPTPPATGPWQDDLRDLADGAAVVLLGKLARIARGAFIWVLTLLCGLEVQGLYSLAWGVCTTLNKAARFGLQRGVVYVVATARAAPDTTAAESVAAVAAGLRIGLLSGVTTALLLQAAATSVAAFYGQPVAAALRIMAWTAPCVALAWVLTSATRALRIVRYDVYVRSVCGPLLLLGGGLAVGGAGGGLTGIAWVQLAAGVGSLLCAAGLFARHYPLGATLRGVLAAPGARSLTRFCAPVALTDLIYGVLTQLDVLMLGWFVDAALVGVYVLARRLASVLLKAPQAFDAIFSAVVSDLSARRRESELTARYVTVTRWILTVNLPVIATLLLAAGPLLDASVAAHATDGVTLDQATGVFLVLVLGMMLQSVLTVAEPLLAMSGHPGLNLVNNLVWLATNFGLNLWLIDALGIVGAALGAAGAMAVVNALRLLEVRWLRGITPLHRQQLKPLAAAALAALPAWALHGSLQGSAWRGGLPAVAFLTVYLLALVRLGPEPEDRTLVSAWSGWIRARRPTTPAPP